MKPKLKIRIMNKDIIGGVKRIELLEDEITSCTLDGCGHVDDMTFEVESVDFGQWYSHEILRVTLGKVIEQ